MASNLKTNYEIWPTFDFFRDFMPVLETSMTKEVAIQTEGAIPRISKIWTFLHSQAKTFVTNCKIWQKFKLVRDAMPALNTCKFKFEKIAIKTEGDLTWTRSFGIFSTQWQITLRTIAKYG